MNQAHLLTFRDAQIAGEAMFDRWSREADIPPPMVREDQGWADLARVAWEAIHNARLAQADRSPKGEKPQALNAKHESAVESEANDAPSPSLSSSPRENKR